MPRISVDINEVHKCITRPVVQSVIRDLLARLNETAAKVEMRMAGDGGAIITPGSAIDDDTKFRLSTDSRIEVEYEDDYDEDHTRSTPVIRSEAPMVFWDKTTQTTVQPVRQNVKGRITFRYNGRDRQEVARALRRYKTLISRDMDQYPHKLTYSYDIPPNILMAIKDIYALRETRGGYMDSWEQYLEKCFSKRQTVAYTMNGDNPVCKIQESSVKAISYYENADETPKISKDDEAGGYYAEFSVVLYYDRVESFLFCYPSVVHHSFMPAQWLNLDGIYAKEEGMENNPDYYHYPNAAEDEAAEGGLRVSNLAYFTYAFRGSLPHRAFKGVQDPNFSEWVQTKHYVGYQPLVRQIVLRRDNDPKRLHEVGDFWHYKMSQNAIEYMCANKDALMHSYENVFTYTLYKGDDILDQRALTIDDDFNIFSDKELDVRANYHLILGICNDPSMLSPDARKTLACFPYFFYDYLYLIQPELACKYRPKIEAALSELDEDDDECLPTWLMNEIWQDIWNCTSTRGLNNKGLKTVGIFDIISHTRKKETNDA